MTATIRMADISPRVLSTDIRRAAEMLPDHRTYEDTPSDEVPVIKFFTPDGGATWWLSEYDPQDEVLFGLCDLGMGFPELGYVSLPELEAVRGALGLQVEIDLWWEGTMADAKRAAKA